MKALRDGEAAEGDGCGMETSVRRRVGERNCASVESGWKEK
jgi:hypothetical protein